MASLTQWTEFEQTPGDSGGQESLACCSPWAPESDTTEPLNDSKLSDSVLGNQEATLTDALLSLFLFHSFT